MAANRLTSNLLESLGMVECEIYSYKNFHARGIHYINLFRSCRLTVKLYIFDNPPHAADGWLVWPHNHAYNFHHETLVGEICNTRFQMVDKSQSMQGKLFDMYSYATPLNGGKGLTKFGMQTGLKATAETIVTGDSYYLECNEIHTIATASDYAAAVLTQYHDIRPETPTLMFANAGEKVSCGGEGVYERPTQREIRKLIDRFKSEWREGQTW